MPIGVVGRCFGHRGNAGNEEVLRRDQAKEGAARPPAGFLSVAPAASPVVRSGPEAPVLTTVLMLIGCRQIEDAVQSDVTGSVVDNRGDPVGDATVRLFDLLDNTAFVEGGDVASATAYIDREAVLGSTHSVAEGTTGDDGQVALEAV